MEKVHISEFEYDQYEIDRAFFFLADALQSSGHNPKPVFSHSLLVTEMLWERGLPQNIVLAGILHDVVEDTDITIEDVERSFGKTIAGYVDALTISNNQDIYRSFERCAELGDEVLTVRAADLIQNSYYYKLAPQDVQVGLRAKFERFIELYADRIIGSMKDALLEAYAANVKDLPAARK